MKSRLVSEYPAIRVFSASKAIGHGNRIVYWVGSDGKRCLVFNCTGELFTIANSDLSFDKVVNAAAYSFEGGRLRVRRANESVLVDYGPMTAAAVRKGDRPLSAIRKGIGKEQTIDDVGSSSDDGFWEGDRW